MLIPLPILAGLTLVSCKTEPAVQPADNGPAPAVVEDEPHIRRLTTEQYEVAITALLGEGLVMPSTLEPDTPIEGKLSIGAGTTSVSSWGAERYEDASYLLAEQAVEDVVPCSLDVTDLTCARDFFSDFGRRAWRRSLSEVELDRLVAIVDSVSGDSDFALGMVHGIAAVIQSPYFLYRIELGEPDPERPGARRLTDVETATRLAFLLWNQPPDTALLDVAESGSFDVAAEAKRMMDDPRFRDGMRALFSDILELYRLDDISKDPLIYTHASPDLGPAAREETLRLIEYLVVDVDADFRDLMTTRTTFVDQRLAALYDIPAPVPGDFGRTQLPDNGQRRGLLGHASMLNLHAHSGGTSSTLRGAFVRRVLLCQSIPPPPAGLNTAIPEPDVDSPTLRERMASHMEDPSCAVCHAILDPVGLGLENFDGVGRWRTHENGAQIDPSGELDDASFDDAWDLALQVRKHEAFVPCWAEHLHEVATGHAVKKEQDALMQWYATELEQSGYSWRSLMLAAVTSPTFRHVGGFEE